MPKISSTLCFILLIFLGILPLNNQVQALPGFEGAPACPSVGVALPLTNPNPIPEDQSSVDITFPRITDGRYKLRLRNGSSDVYAGDYTDASGGTMTIKVDNTENKLAPGEHGYTVQRWYPNDKSDPSKGEWKDYCGYMKYKVGFFYNDCRLVVRPDQPLKDNENYAVDIFNAPKGAYPLQLGTQPQDPYHTSGITLLTIDIDRFGNGTSPSDLNAINPPQDTELSLYFLDKGGVDPKVNPGHFCVTKLSVKTAGGDARRPIPPPGPPPGLAGENCQQRAARDPNVRCTSSGGPNCGGSDGIVTAIGCISTQPVTLTKTILRFAVAISGGIAFLLMVFGAFGMITSAGNPENLEASKDRFSKAVIGLLVVVFSVLLLKIIGVDILGLGGFLGV